MSKDNTNVPDPAPRYDDVYFEGVRWLDGLAKLPADPYLDGYGPVRDKRPYCCPACNGHGTVSRPPYVAGDQPSWGGTGMELYSCRACGGTGIVWG